MSLLTSAKHGILGSNLKSTKLSKLEGGEVIAVSMGPYYHYGIYIGGDRVIDVSELEGVFSIRDYSIDNFRETPGNKLFVSVDEDMQGGLHSIYNAYQYKSRGMEYKFVSNNCVDFVELCSSPYPWSKYAQLYGAMVVSRNDLRYELQRCADKRYSKKKERKFKNTATQALDIIECIDKLTRHNVSSEVVGDDIHNSKAYKQNVHDVKALAIRGLQLTKELNSIKYKG